MGRYRGTLILLGILVALGAFVYIFELGAAGGTADQGPEPVIFALSEQDIVHVTWRDGDKTTDFEKDDAGKWWIVGPKKAPADEWSSDTLLWRLSILKADRLVVDKADDLSQYGLAQPAMELILGMKDGHEESLLLGDQNPLGTGYYAQKPGSQELYLINISVITDIRGFARPATPTPSPTPGTPEPSPTPGG
ncbi:MAG: DUF4340 domain-containing protein [Chloroflexota bacterium]